MDLSPDEDNFQGRLLHQAALWDNVELLQELLASGADVDARDACSRTALHAAALAERSRCLAALCAAGANVNALSDSSTVDGGKTALHIAAERGHVENIRALLSSGADLELADGAGDHALTLAEKGSHRHAAAALKEARDALERDRLAKHAHLRELVSRGDSQQLKLAVDALGPSAGIIANMTPGGANTLLYVASELGQPAVVSLLVGCGADGRAHPVTQYCPLYIACYHGNADVVVLLLKHFPRAVQLETVERWLPLHAACIGGHASIVTLLLNYPYPESVLTTYTDITGKWRYAGAFDVNACDASGQSALYVACTLGNVHVADALLSYSVVAERVDQSGESVPTPAPSQVLSPTRSGISLGIHAIVNKLTGGGSSKNEPSDSTHRIHPVRVDATRAGDSCAARAARGGHAALLRRLLAAGALPDAAAAPPPQLLQDRRRSVSMPRASSRTSPSPCRGSYSSDRDVPWTALSIAARAKNMQIVEMLLNAGATDPGWRALRECVTNGQMDLVALLLRTKAFPDPENKLNKPSISETVFMSRSDASLTFNCICPTTPVMLDWRELNCHLTTIRMSWIRAASLHVNTNLSTSVNSLHAVTRIDLSNNDLTLLPPDLFAMISLRYLNVAQNKLERLPSPSDPFEDEVDSKGRRIKKKSPRPEVYSAPVLQELYLQDNRLEELPPSLFSLPSLVTLHVSNNKLRALPPEMWASSVREVNASLNLLRDLPRPAKSSPECGSKQLSSQCETSPRSGQASNSQTKSSSRSPSMECPVIDNIDEDCVVIGDRTGNAVRSDPQRVHTWRGVSEPRPPAPPPGGVAGGHTLTTLDISHNQLGRVPPVLACVAPNLTALNMSYNSLRSMSYVTSYPASLRQLDLSHNEITCWPSLPQLEHFSDGSDPLECFCPRPSRQRVTSGSHVSHRNLLLSAACDARRQLRLASLRTLILSNNMLTRIQLTTDDDGNVAVNDGTDNDDVDEWGASCNVKGRLLFPMLSMLDVSCNMLRNIPPAIHELTNLSVLNISGNKDITDLPPQMGLLSRLWNLNTVGCSLQEPLRTMIQSGRYKSMDIIGYLKSVLQEAKTYARMRLMIVGLQGIGKTSLLECLRQESAIQHRRKNTDHWSKRMGNKSPRGNMSTVGVDIGSWVYEKHRSTRGAVTFRTWDFGGQQEYYATHQYFLSRRCLYLVVWRVIDGKRGLAGAVQWLRSIQARAPGAPVIMVATHYDQVPNSNLPESECPESLQHLIRTRVMAAPDRDKLGLPRVVDSIEVSCSTRHNIRLLADIIYSVAFSVKPPGSKVPLLEQRIPARYLQLEECVTSLAAENKDPVMTHAQYTREVNQYMVQKNYKMFRDAAELHQATMFLHENGVLLHYDDATLKQLYFLRPQWLCDVLAHVVTVREINPFANNGIMKIEDLAHVFKASPQLAAEEVHSLGISLLNKFELALCWDNRVLLVPSLLPDKRPAQPQLSLRSRQLVSGHVTARPTGIDSPTLIQEPQITITGRDSSAGLLRLLCVTYVPRGFWARCAVRVLSDANIPQAACSVYTPPAELSREESLCKALSLEGAWRVWGRGVELCCGSLTLASVSEVPHTRDPVLGGYFDGEQPDHAYSDLSFRIQQDGAWTTLNMQDYTCIEIHVRSQLCKVSSDKGIAGYQSITIEPDQQSLAKLLAILTEHVDLLLEDWYPSLGTRFVHTSEGRSLITRVVPCPACMRAVPPTATADRSLQQAPEVAHGGMETGHVRGSAESRGSDRDSGVGADSNASSRTGSSEGRPPLPPLPPLPPRPAHAWTLEACMLCACACAPLLCAPLLCAPLLCAAHGEVPLHSVAPDTLLLDLPPAQLARWEHISRDRSLGRGAFGAVSRGVWRRGADSLRVAVKALQPVVPPDTRDVGAMQAYKAWVSGWERLPLSSSCRAYLTLRQELSVLTRLRHCHTVSLLAACRAPLALILELAPQGALDAMLRSYSASGARVAARCARALLVQVARALDYLHASRILYRDLKSENVLVWSMPRPQDSEAAEFSPQPIPVHVKLGDYGISRFAPPSGTKGFGGTEGFMAPEIMKYNGEEEYTEKVDCFSFGMLIYEVVTLRQPFEGHEAVKDAVLDGARPSLSSRDLEAPVCILETMRRCWSLSPTARPSAGALACCLSAPECGPLRDAARGPGGDSAAATCVMPDPDGECGGWEVWCGGGESERVHCLTLTPTRLTQHYTIALSPGGTEPVHVTAVCRVGGCVWVGDSLGRITVYSASTCAVQWRVSMEELVGSGSALSALHSLAEVERVAVAMKCGRLFIVSSKRPEEESGFVLTELGAASHLACLAAFTTDQGMELWAGGDSLYTYSVNKQGVCAARTLPAPATATATVPATVPATATAPATATVPATTTATGRITLIACSEQRVIVYMEPGVCIYQYLVSTKQQSARLDVSKLAPCSESIQSMVMDEDRGEESCRVTALCVLRELVYAGTARGCIVVADVATLRPLTVFRPYEGHVQCIVPLPPHKGAPRPMLASIGDGYRPLLNRFTSQQNTNQPTFLSGYHCLLWTAHHWLPD